MLGIREGANITISRRNFFVSVPKISVGESFTVALISGIEKVWIRGGGRGREYQDFPLKLFCLTVPKNFLKDPLVFH